MNRILLIGYGNQTRSDDGVGWYVAEQIEKKVSEVAQASRLDVLKLHQLTLELAEELKDRELVIFVDARVPQAGASTRIARLGYCQGSGDDDWLRSEEVKPNYKIGLTTHYFTPETLLAICEGLYRKFPKAHLFSIKGVNFNFGEVLSDQVKNVADQAVEQILKMVKMS